MWSGMKMGHHEIFHLTDCFAVDNSTENYVENHIFCPMENSKFWSKKIFLISSGNKSEIILIEDSISKIHSGISSSIPSEDNYNYAITSRINSTITSGTIYNSTIPSGKKY